MRKCRVKESFFVFTFAVVFGITPVSFADQTSIGSNPDKPLTQEIKDETVDVSQTIKNYTIKQRDEAVKNAKAALIDLFHYVFKMSLIHGQLVSCRIADLLEAISVKPNSACWVAASSASKTRFAK